MASAMLTCGGTRSAFVISLRGPNAQPLAHLQDKMTGKTPLLPFTAFHCKHSAMWAHFEANKRYTNKHEDKHGYTLEFKV